MAEATVPPSSENLAPPMPPKPTRTNLQNGLMSPSPSPGPDPKRFTAKNAEQPDENAPAGVGNGPEKATPSDSTPAQPQVQAPALPQAQTQSPATEPIIPSIEDLSAPVKDAVEEDVDMSDDEGGDGRLDPDKNQERIIDLILKIQTENIEPKDINTEDIEKEMGFDEGGALGATAEARLTAFRKLAIQIHPKLIKGDAATNAWYKLKKLGKEKFSIRHDHIEELEEWDGDDFRWSSFSAPEPPSQEALYIYGQATEILGTLSEDPENEAAQKMLEEANSRLDDNWKIQTSVFLEKFREAKELTTRFIKADIKYPEALEAFKSLNNFFMDFNRKNQYPANWLLTDADLIAKAKTAFLADVDVAKLELPEIDKFLISGRKTLEALDGSGAQRPAQSATEKCQAALQNLTNNFQHINDLMVTLDGRIGKETRTDELSDTYRQVEELKNALKECVKQRQDVRASLDALTQEDSTDQNRQSPSKFVSQVTYEWDTGRTAKGEVIVAYVMQGRGCRLLVETKTESGYLRYYIPGREAGKAELAAYEALQNTKNLKQTDGILKATAKANKEHFSHILWFPKTSVQKYNAAQGPMRSPPAHFPAVYKNGTVEMITVTTLKTWIGEDRAVGVIEEACKEIGIPPPWRVKPAQTVNRPEWLKRNKDQNGTHKKPEQDTTTDGGTLELEQMRQENQKMREDLASMKAMLEMLMKGQDGPKPQMSDHTTSGVQ